MTATPNALLLVGSAKPVGSTSELLGSRLLQPMLQRGWQQHCIRLATHLTEPHRVERLLQAVDEADLVVLSFGLYMDSPPAPVIRAMEILAAHRRSVTRRPRLAALVNCALPDASQAAATLPMVQLFARDAAFDWAGGLAMGMSEMLNGAPLEEAGPMARHAIRGLDLAAEALMEGREIPAEARNLLARPFVPRWLFLWFGMKRWTQSRPRHWGEADLPA